MDTTIDMILPELKEFEKWVSVNLDTATFQCCHAKTDTKVEYKFFFEAEDLNLFNFYEFKRSIVDASVFLDTDESYDHQEFHQVIFKPNVDTYLQEMIKMTDESALAFKYRFFKYCCIYTDSPLIESIEDIGNPNHRSWDNDNGLIIAFHREKRNLPWKLVNQFKLTVRMKASRFNQVVIELKKFLLTRSYC